MNKQKVFMTIKNGYLIRERIANGFYSVLRIPLKVTCTTSKQNKNLFREMGIKEL